MSNNYTYSFTNATGKIDYNMTNDFMFRYILQKNQKVLKGVICSLLHMKPEQIQKIEIQNPINLSGEISAKEFILDIKVMLNDNSLINLEMQVANQHNWVERSLAYLSRTFDQLYQGQHYEDALPVHHIGFLDFTLFPQVLEFYSTYKMMNIRNYHIYSDKFTLSVVDLKHIELATEEDKTNGIDYWARLFKAKTWEEIKMLAKNNEYLQEAADSLYVANSDDIIREQCLARQEAERHERTMKRDMQRLKERAERLEAEKEQLEAEKEQLITHHQQLEAKTHFLGTNEKRLQEENMALKSSLSEMELYMKQMELRMKQMEELLHHFQKQ